MTGRPPFQSYTPFCRRRTILLSQKSSFVADPHDFFFRFSSQYGSHSKFAESRLKCTRFGAALTRKFLKAEVFAPGRKKLAGRKRGEYMTLEEKKRRIQEMRREFREAHQELMDALDRVSKRFEPDHRHPEKTLW